MKKIIIVSVVLTLFSICELDAENNGDSLKNKYNRLTVGININDFGRDFGLGINLTSPYFFMGALAVRASENYQWLSHIDIKGNNVWSGYHNIRIGILGANYMLNHSIRLYGEGGISIVVGNTDITSSNMALGGYGLFGFEFFVTRRSSYFIELGGIGSGANADKVFGKPIYGNGFLSSVGFRVSL